MQYSSQKTRSLYLSYYNYQHNCRIITMLVCQCVYYAVVKFFIRRRHRQNSTFSTNFLNTPKHTYIIIAVGEQNSLGGGHEESARRA